MVVFTVPGKPQGKARARTKKNGQTYTPRNTVEYEDRVKACYMESQPRQRWFEKEPLAVSIYAKFGIPKSKPKSVKLAMMEGKITPTVKPDADNIAKIICDALNGIAYGDDSQIIRLTTVKCYVHKEDMPPHVTVSIESLMGGD